MPLKLGAFFFLIHYTKHDGCLILKGEMVRNQHIPLVLRACISQRGLRGVAETNDPKSQCCMTANDYFLPTSILQCKLASALLS